MELLHSTLLQLWNSLNFAVRSTNSAANSPEPPRCVLPSQFWWSYSLFRGHSLIQAVAVHIPFFSSKACKPPGRTQIRPAKWHVRVVFGVTTTKLAVQIFVALSPTAIVAPTLTLMRAVPLASDVTTRPRILGIFASLGPLLQRPVPNSLCCFQLCCAVLQPPFDPTNLVNLWTF